MARQVGRKQRERGEVRLDTPALPLPLIHSFIDSFTLTLTLLHTHTHTHSSCVQALHSVLGMRDEKPFYV